MDAVQNRIREILEGIERTEFHHDDSESTFFIRTILHLFCPELGVESIDRINLEGTDDYSDVLRLILSHIEVTNCLLDLQNLDLWKSEKVKIFKKVVINFFSETNRFKEFFQYVVWLEINNTSSFLFQMNRIPKLRWLSTYLMTFFIKPFFELYNVSCVQLRRMNRTAERIHLLSGDMSEISIDCDELKEMSAQLYINCKDHMKCILPVIAYKETSPISSQLDDILDYIVNNEIFFKDFDFFFNYFLDCSMSENNTIRAAVLKSLRAVLLNKSVTPEREETLLRQLAEEKGACCLYALMTNFCKMQRLVEMATSIVIQIFESNILIPSWTDRHYCTVFMNIFKRTGIVPELTGKLMFLSLKYLSDKDKFIRIMDFYIQYKGAADDFSILINAIWSFDYMKNFKNIFDHLVNPRQPDYDNSAEVKNAALLHFATAIMKRLVIEENCLELVRSNLIYVIPAMKLLRNSQLLVGILMGVFYYAELNNYEPELIGSQTHVNQLIDELKYMITTKTDYEFILMAMSIFFKLRHLRYDRATIEIGKISKKIFKNFTNANFDWVAAISVCDNQLLKTLEVSSYRLSILLNQGETLNTEEFRAVFNIVYTTLIERDPFKDSTIEYKMLEIFYLEIMSKLLVTTFESIVDDDIENKEKQIEFKTVTLAVIEKLFEYFQRSDISLFQRERALESMLNSLKTIQPVFILATGLESIAHRIQPEMYLTILKIVTDVLYEEGVNLDPSDEQLKQKLIKNLTKFFVDFEGLPTNSIEWEYFGKFLLCPNFEKEINELLLAIANMESEFEPKYRRISSLLAIVCIKWCDNNVDGKAVLRRLADLFKNNMENWQLLFSNIIAHMAGKLSQRVGAIPPINNRILSVNYFKAFTFRGGTFAKDVISRLRLLSRELTRYEMKTLQEFSSLFV